MSRSHRAYLNALEVAVIALHWTARRWDGFPRVQEELRCLANELSDRIEAVKARTSHPHITDSDAPTERVTMVYGVGLDQEPEPKPTPPNKK